MLINRLWLMSPDMTIVILREVAAKYRISVKYMSQGKITLRLSDVLKVVLILHILFNLFLSLNPKIRDALKPIQARYRSISTIYKNSILFVNYMANIRIYPPGSDRDKNFHRDRAGIDLFLPGPG